MLSQSLGANFYQKQRGTMKQKLGKFGQLLSTSRVNPRREIKDATITNYNVLRINPRTATEQD